MAKLITVFGATGYQGGAVARALLVKEGGFQVRAVTRNPDSEKAKALKTAGAEVVKADLNDTGSVERAVQGAYGVFLVTDYQYGGLLWQQDPEKAKDAEITQGRGVGDACKKAGVIHLVYSGLELVQGIIGVPCPHMDSKGIVEKYLDEIGVPNTSTRYPFYYDNFATIMIAQKQDDGTYSFTLPMDGPMDAIGVEDGGPAVASILANPDEFIGKKIGFTGDRLTIQQYMDVVAKLTGKTIRYHQVTPEQFAQFPFPAASGLAAMFDFWSRVKPQCDFALTKRLNPGVRSFEKWATDNKDLFKALYSS